MKLSAQPGVVRNIAWQLADAGTSVAANYEEAKGSYSRREFAAKSAIVLKEAREARLWLRVILACRLASEAEAGPLYDEANRRAKAVILWDSEEAANAAEETLAERRRQMASGVGLTVESADLFEALVVELEGVHV